MTEQKNIPVVIFNDEHGNPGNVYRVDDKSEMESLAQHIQDNWEVGEKYSAVHKMVSQADMEQFTKNAEEL